MFIYTSKPDLVGIAQCKRFQFEAIGPNYIQEFFAAKHSAKVERGYFFTTSRFTPAAYREARLHSIILYDILLIQQWIHDIRQREDNQSSGNEIFSPSLIRVPVICVANNKGGVGKTSITVNLAAALAEEGGDVLVIDADPQADATFWLTGRTDIDDQLSLYTVLVNNESIRPYIQKTSASGVWILPASQGLNDIPKSLREFEWEKRIGKALLQFPITDPPIKYILIDSRPALDSLACSALITSHYLLIPFRLDNFSHEGARHFIDFVGRQETRHNILPVTILGGVANFVTQTKIAKKFSDEIAKLVLSLPRMQKAGITQDRFWCGSLRQREDFLTALSKQVPVTEIRRSDAAYDVRELAKEVKRRVNAINSKFNRQ